MLESCFEFEPSGALVARGLFHTPSGVKNWVPVIGWYGNAWARGAASSPSATTASARTRRGEMRFMSGLPPWDKRVRESRRTSVVRRPPGASLASLLHLCCRYQTSTTLGRDTPGFSAPAPG